MEPPSRQSPRQQAHAPAEQIAMELESRPQMPMDPALVSGMPVGSNEDAGEIFPGVEGMAPAQRRSEVNGRAESGGDDGETAAIGVRGNGSEGGGKDGDGGGGCELYVGDLPHEVFDQELQASEDVDVLTRRCHCGKAAIMKIAGRNSENRGLRYLSCEAFAFFAKKRKRTHCKFFQWVDPPRASREQVREHKKEARAIKREKLEIRTQTQQQQTAIRTRAAARHEKEQTTEVPQAMADTFQDETDNALDKGQNGTKTGLFSTTMRVISSAVAGEVCKAKPQVIESNPMDQGYHISLKTQDAQKGSEDCSFPKGDKMSMQVDRNNETTEEGGTEVSVNIGEGLPEAPICLCSQKAIMKVVKSRGPNKGLRYLICPNARPLFSKGKRPRSCKFFMWVDTPEQKKEEIK